MPARVSKSLAASLASKQPGGAESSPSKYKNRKTTIGDLVFASKAEAKRYGELRILEAAGEISNLRLQPRYKLQVYGKHICDYVADFTFVAKDGRCIIEDVKGVETRDFKIKSRLMAACYGVEVSIVR